MSELELFKPGSKVVILSSKDIKGVIVSVMVEGGDHISYKVAWWNGRSRCCEWMDEEEIDLVNCDDVTHIGFKS